MKFEILIFFKSSTQNIIKSVLNRQRLVLIDLMLCYKQIPNSKNKGEI